MMNNRNLTSTLDRMLTLNRALDEAFAAGSSGSRSSVWVPAMDIAERAEGFSIQVDLPGVRPEDVELDFEQGVLTIRGAKPSVLDAKAAEECLHARERVSGAFERALRLPNTVDADAIDASFANGVLTITVPKAQAAMSRRIQIRGAEARKEVEA
jgi:HSP20 family protein